MMTFYEIKSDDYSIFTDLNFQDDHIKKDLGNSCSKCSDLASISMRRLAET